MEFLWTQFPVKVFTESPPERWQRSLQYALDAWNNVVPLRQVIARQEADIIISWAGLQEGMMGTERCSPLVVKEGNRVVKRLKTAYIILDNSHHLSGPQMLFTVLHELGHALGINGHSGGSRDVMLPELDEMTEKSVTLQTGLTRTHAEVSWTPIIKNLSPRDVNTVIRLYNCPGPAVPLK